ncbi:copia protein [Tanacetum coccineum]
MYAFSITIPPPPPSFNPLPQHATPTPTQFVLEVTTSFPALPNFSSVFRFNDRVTNLEKDLSEMKKLTECRNEALDDKREYIDLIDTSVRAIMKEEVNTQLPHILPQAVSDFATPILWEPKIEEHKSYLRAEYKKELYDALVESYNTDKDLFETYGEVFTLKRSRDDKDKDQDPSVGSDQGMKKRKMSKDTESSRDLKSNESKSSSSSKDHLKPWISDIAHAEKPPTSFFVDSYGYLIDFSAFVMNRLNITNLTQELLGKQYPFSDLVSLSSDSRSSRSSSYPSGLLYQQRPVISERWKFKQKILNFRNKDKVRYRCSFPRSSQNWRDLPRDNPLVSVEVLSRHGPSDAMHNPPSAISYFAALDGFGENTRDWAHLEIETNKDYMTTTPKILEEVVHTEVWRTGSTFVDETLRKSDQLHQTFEKSSIAMTRKLDDMIELPKSQPKRTYNEDLECEIVMVKMPKCMAWLDDEPIGDLDTMKDKAEKISSPSKYPKVLFHFKTLIGPIILSSLVDRWIWDLNGEGTFRVQDARNLLDEFFLPKDPVATRCVKSTPIKVNVFAWKLHLDRLQTRMNLARKGVQISSMMCPLCNNVEEDSSHLFCGCDMAIDISRLVCRWWQLA